MFAEMMRKLMYPHGKEAIFCCGKGGNVGGKYMMEAAIELLRRQGHSGERRRIVMVGDRFDTDVRAGLSVGIRTCLVTSGCHKLECQQFYRMDPAHFYAPTVAHLTATNDAAEGAAKAEGAVKGAAEAVAQAAAAEARAWCELDAKTGGGSQRTRAVSSPAPMIKASNVRRLSFASNLNGLVG